MTATAPSAPAPGQTVGESPPSAIALHWSTRLQRLHQHLLNQGASPARTLVLVPYAQVMAQARLAWRQLGVGGLVPRFETTRNWAQQLAPFEPGELDFGKDPARNRVLAARLLEPSGVARLPVDLAPALIEQLLEAAAQLAPLAASVPPHERSDWGQQLRDDMAQLAPGAAASWEAMVQAVAIEWVRHSAFATDVLWQHALPGQALDAMVVLEGIQTDPLAEALAARWGGAALRLPLQVDAERHTPPVLHPCSDAQDEAQRAAACVLAELNAGHTPVALVAQDRVLTRRIHALLQGAGVPVRDETGWRLSTSHAAARLMAVLRACSPRASTDEVVDALKHMPCWPAPVADALERQWRQAEVSTWTAVCGSALLRETLPAGLESGFEALRAPRPLAQWLTDLAQVLRDWAVWPVLEGDLAGRALLRALWLVREPGAEPPAWLALAERKLSLSAFSAWLREVLEAANFVPPSPDHAPVIVLPMAQLLARPLAAVVAAGCDDVHLSAAPEPPGLWTPAQRERLGLPGREALGLAARAAWSQMLTQPRVHLLWRQHEGEEPVLPNPWVQVLLGQGGDADAETQDPRVARGLDWQPVRPPQPSAPALLPRSLSASAYSDLRDCPYRFFALRQLGLGELSELDTEPGKRDLGNWLHRVLKAFHEARPEPRALAEDLAALEPLAGEVAQAMGLDNAAFLPFRAAWPALRDGYLDWLHGFEERPGQAGPRFAEAEVSREADLRSWRIKGQLDRIDRQRSPEGDLAVVIDYKTESRSTTDARLRQPLEDTQLAFYAALLPDDTLRAAYLSLGEGQGGVAWLEQQDILAARDALLEGLPHDMDRLADGAPLPALGEGQACEYCAARGLCRKDFWTKHEHDT